MTRKVRCTCCGFTADESEFGHNRDFFQFVYISRCPNCDVRVAPGDVGLLAMGKKPIFELIEEAL